MPACEGNLSNNNNNNNNNIKEMLFDGLLNWRKVGQSIYNFNSDHNECPHGTLIRSTRAESKCDLCANHHATYFCVDLHCEMLRIDLTIDHPIGKIDALTYRAQCPHSSWY
jgi:hypothetical protein